MAWRNRNNPTPEEIQQDDAEMQGIKDKVAKIDAIEAGQAELKTTITSEFETLKASLAGLQVQSKPPEQQPPEQQNDDFYTDVEKSVNDRARAAAMPGLMSMAAISLDQVARSVEKDKDGNYTRKFPDWDMFAPEIEEILSKSPIQQRCNKAVIENAYFIVKGKHADEMVQHHLKKDGRFFVESGSNGGIQQQSKDKSTELSEAERKTAEKFGLTPEQYIAQKGKMQYV